MSSFSHSFNKPCQNIITFNNVVSFASAGAIKRPVDCKYDPPHFTTPT